jgi:hypothetical protein
VTVVPVTRPEFRRRHSGPVARDAGELAAAFKHRP